MLKNKKKIACFALASALVIPCAIGLTGCGNSHTHAFNSDPFYEVVTEDGTKIARSWRECSCGAEDAHKKVDNAVIATPETAQSILDGNIDNKVIVFDEGDYSRLEIRPTKETATIYQYEYTTDAETQTKTYPLNTIITTDPSELPKANAHYTYKRDLSNVTFAGTEGATFKGVFTIQSMYGYNKLAETNADVITYDYIRDVEMYSTSVKDADENEIGNNACVSYINIDKMSFERMNFYGQNGRIYTSYTFVGPSIKNLSVTNCTFDTETRLTATYAAVRLQSNVSVYEDFKLDNNKVNNFFQGLYVANVKNVEMIGNNISNTTHNAIAVASESSGKSSGTISIKGNKISNIYDRPIKIHSTENATNITISNNTILDTVSTEVIQIKTLNNGSYTISNNTFDGVLLAEVSGTNSNATNIEIFTPGVEPEITYPEE